MTQKEVAIGVGLLFLLFAAGSKKAAPPGPGGEEPATSNGNSKKSSSKISSKKGKGGKKKVSSSSAGPFSRLSDAQLLQKIEDTQGEIKSLEKEFALVQKQEQGGFIPRGEFDDTVTRINAKEAELQKKLLALVEEGERRGLHQ